MSGLKWSAWAAVAPGANNLTLQATETTVAPSFNAQTTTRQIALTLTADAARTFAYDDNGSMTSNGATQTYEWDAANRLVAINYPGTSLRSEFTYDGLSRWVKIVEKAGATVTSEKRFVWEGYSIAEERDASNAVTRRYFGQGEQRGVLNLFYARDHLGSIREVTDDTGALRASYDYAPWGKRTKLAGDLDCEFGFTGHYQHGPSGSVVAPRRFYTAEFGRWLSRDPIGEQGGLNLYGYVGNGPVYAMDPLGLAEVNVEVSSSNMVFFDRYLDVFPAVVNSPADLATKVQRQVATGDSIAILTINAHGGTKGTGIIILGGVGEGIQGNIKSPGVPEAIAKIAPLMSPNGICILAQCYTVGSNGNTNSLLTLAQMLGVPVIGTPGEYNPLDFFEEGGVAVYPDGRVVRIGKDGKPCK